MPRCVLGEGDHRVFLLQCEDRVLEGLQLASLVVALDGDMGREEHGPPDEREAQNLDLGYVLEGRGRKPESVKMSRQEHWFGTYTTPSDAGGRFSTLLTVGFYVIESMAIFAQT
jgi:hypothetical protein